MFNARMDLLEESINKHIDMIKKKKKYRTGGNSPYIL